MIVAIVAMSFLLPVMCLAFFVAGFNLGRKKDVEKVEIADVFPSLPKAYRETEAERKARLLAQNIENFGTPVPQQEVK